MGYAIAASIPMTATTIISSINVKPPIEFGAARRVRRMEIPFSMPVS
jgi:hypothetical protein